MNRSKIIGGISAEVDVFALQKKKREGFKNRASAYYDCI